MGGAECLLWRWSVVLMEMTANAQSLNTRASAALAFTSTADFSAGGVRLGLGSRANKTPGATGFNTQQAYFGFINGLELNQVHAFAPVNCTAL